MARLPIDLKVLILSYVPLKRLQFWEAQGYIPSTFFTPNMLAGLLRTRYGWTNQMVRRNLGTAEQSLLLTPFEQYAGWAMVSGDIGYLGQWYLPVDICLVYAAQARDLELLQYYWLRNYSDPVKDDTNTRWLRTVLAIFTNNKQIAQFLEQTGYVQAPFFRSGNEPTLKMALENVDPDSLIKLLANRQDFPFVSPECLTVSIAPRLIIVTEKVVAAKVMFEVVQANFSPSQNRDDYLEILRLLLGQPVQDESILHRLAANEAQYFLALGLSVLNPWAARQLWLRTVDKRFTTMLLYSQVIYDVPTLRYWLEVSKAWSTDRIEMSVFWAKRQLEYMLVGDKIRYTFPLLKEYDRLREGLIWHPITDPETALRLSQVINVPTNQLQPRTEFSRKLMQQFGLL